MRVATIAAVIAAIVSASASRAVGDESLETETGTWVDSAEAVLAEPSELVPLPPLPEPVSESFGGTWFDESPASGSYPSSAITPYTQLEPWTYNRRAAAHAPGYPELVNIPPMIGDAAAGAGGGGAIGFFGLLTTDVAHPTFAGSRLTIADANSPLPTDRVYYSYRQLNRATPETAYQFQESFDLDQHQLAWENAFWDRTASVELRVPIEQRLGSNIFSTIVPPDPIAVVDGSLGSGRETELGNISLVFKMLLAAQPNVAVSGGLGITVPTARDVNHDVVTIGNTSFPNMTGSFDLASAFLTEFHNETVYLTPFLAWIVAPSRSWFHQGFVQIDIPTNPSHVTVDGFVVSTVLDANSAVLGFNSSFTEELQQVHLHAQPLMRLNLGWGYLLAERHTAQRSNTLTALLELHYTTTLDDVATRDVPLATVDPLGLGTLQLISAGNTANRVDQVNASTGLSAQWGPWFLTNGIVVPLNDFPDRSFDFQYNLQLHRQF